MKTRRHGALVRFSHLRTHFHDAECTVKFPIGISSMLPQITQPYLMRPRRDAEENH
jgi:hypothetical protein